MQLQKSRHAILSRLWVFGCYGAWAAQGVRLVGESGPSEGQEEFARFVRKRDNTLHDVAAIGMLREFGVVLTHTPLSVLNICSIANVVSCVELLALCP